MSEGKPDLLALFPLANVVLFPACSVPLYIFEPRYRQLVGDELRRDARIGMIAVRPEYAHAMQGEPPLFDVGCEGQVIHSNKRPDGTFDIVLRGTRRFRIAREVERTADRLYRVAEVVRIDDAAPERDAAAVKQARLEAIQQLGRLLDHVAPDQATQLSPEHFSGADDAMMVNSLAQSLDFDVLEKQRLLETNSVLDRYLALTESLRFRIAEIELRRTGRGEVVH